MNDGMFRRDRGMLSASPTAQLELGMLDASRAFAPEPPAVKPKGAPASDAAARSGGGGGVLSDAAYAQRLVRDYGPTRAAAIARAEDRAGAAALIEQAVVDAVAMADTVREARDAGWL